MSKDIQEVVQRDTGIEDEEDTEPLPIVENLAKEEPILTETSTITQPIPKKAVPARSFLSIPEEDVVSVKDSVTFGLPVHGSLEGRELGGSSGHPITP